MTLVVDDVVHREDDYAVDPEVVPHLWAMEERHFWHQARNAWIEKALKAAGVKPGARILEVGCGSGWVAGYLHKRGYDVVGVDTAEALVRKAHERFESVRFFASDVGALPRSLGPFDAIGFFDVLEHLDDPMALLGKSLELAREGTVIVATVPACKELHTIIDDLSGHKQRYEPGELATLFRQAGIVAVEERGIFRMTKLIQKVMRRQSAAASAESLDREAERRLMIDNFRIPPFPVNVALRALCAVERALAFDESTGRAGATQLATGRTAMRA